MFVNGCPCYCCRHINFTESEQRTPDYGTCEKEAEVKGYSLELDCLLASISLLAKCVEDLSSDVPSCRGKTVECVCAQSSQKYHSDLLHFRILKIFRCEVVFGGTHLESIVVAPDETSMCMSTASMESTVREGFHASKCNVHTILVL